MKLIFKKNEAVISDQLLKKTVTNAWNLGK